MTALSEVGKGRMFRRNAPISVMSLVFLLFTTSCVDLIGLSLGITDYAVRGPRAEVHVLKDLPRPLQGKLSVSVEPYENATFAQMDLADFSEVIVGGLQARGMQLGSPPMWKIRIQVSRFEPGSVWERMKQSNAGAGLLVCRWSVMDQLGVEIGYGTIEGSIKSGVGLVTFNGVLRIAAFEFANYLAGGSKEGSDEEFE